MSVPVFLLGVDAVATCTFVLLAVVAARNRGRPGAHAAGLLWIALAGIAGLLTAAHAAVVPGGTVVYAVGIGWIALVPLWTAFVFEYTGRGPSITRRWIGLAIVYVTVTGATTWSSGGLDGVFGTLSRVSASLFQNLLFGVGLFGVFLIVRSAVSYDDLPTGQAILLSISGIGVSLLLFSISTVPVYSTTIPPLVSGFFLVIAAGFAASLVRYGLFEDTPGVGVLARRSVLEEMSESLVVVDRERRLVDANETAERTLGVTLADDAGRPAESVLGCDLETIESGTTTLSTPAGKRQFAVSRSALTNARDDAVGTSYLFQDVTDERTRKQRLEVFNRVLRHNLRNDLDAVRGFAEALGDGDIDEPEDLAERIGAIAGDLAAISETVERAERLMTRNSPDLEVVDLERLAEDVTASVADRYDYEWDVTTDSERPTLRTDRAVLRTALRQVVENAVEHSDQREPTVRIDIGRGRDSARIVVHDDGPGIPDREKAILLEGEETPLQHGTGVGLWFVSWAITRLRGDLSFDDTVDTGSAVVFDLPHRPATGEGDTR